MPRYTRPVRYITFRYVLDEAHRINHERMRSNLRQPSRRFYYPACRGKKHGVGWATPVWNIRWDYVGVIQRGMSQSLYWCETCLPKKYRRIAADMRRGEKTWHRIEGEALMEFGVSEYGYLEPKKKGLAAVPRPQEEEI